jgi:hypothetical protein
LLTPRPAGDLESLGQLDADIGAAEVICHA